MTTMLIRGGRIIDPSQGLDKVGNLLLRDGRVLGIDSGTTVADEVIDAAGLIVCPGFVDGHVFLGEPGFEEDESIETGTSAAIAGGITTVAVSPDTIPAVDNRGAAEFILLQAERAGHCNVYPLGTVTKEIAGKELAEIGQLVEGGAVAFTDGKSPIASAEIMWRALEYARMFHCPILAHPQVPELVRDGVMHEGYYSTLLGLRGMPAAAEDIMVGRDAALAERTGGHLHVCCISTAGAVDQVRRAKQRGVKVTADVAAHHLALTDAELQTFDSNFKVDPPLRHQDHVDALYAGLQDGTIDAICSDHRPCAEEKKAREIDHVPFGIVGLETLLPICVRTLIETKLLTWPELIAKLTSGPAGVLGLPKGTLREGADADVTLIDPEARWKIDASQFHSKSRNTPFDEWNVTGRVVRTIVAGSSRFQADL